MNFLLSRSFVRQVAVGTFCFLSGAVLFSHAQTPEDRVAAERATSAFRREGYNRHADGILVSPDGNYAVVDLGDTERYGTKARSHAVYDFATKKVFIVRFAPSTNSIDVASETLR